LTRRVWAAGGRSSLQQGHVEHKTQVGESGEKKDQGHSLNMSETLVKIPRGLLRKWGGWCRSGGKRPSTTKPYGLGSVLRAHARMQRLLGQIG